MLYKILDNSMLIIVALYILYYTIKYRFEKLGTIDTERVSAGLFEIWYNRKVKHETK